MGGEPREEQRTVDPTKVPLKEAEGKAAFTSRRHLERHVADHVLESRDEQWWKLLDSKADTMIEARWEHGQGTVGAHFREIARRYEDMLSRLLVDACKTCRCHSHNADLWWNENWEQEVRAQVIYAWPVKERIFVCASATSRGSGFAPYRLRTGYRRTGLSERAFAELAYQKATDRSMRWERPVIAIHDSEGEDR